MNSLRATALRDQGSLALLSGEGNEMNKAGYFLGKDAAAGQMIARAKKNLEVITRLTLSK